MPGLPTHPYYPKLYLLRKACTNALGHPEAAMINVGSYYVPAAQPSVLEQEANNLLTWPGLPQAGFTVQALIFTVIGLDGSN
jgi:hypothetical protein